MGYRAEIESVPLSLKGSGAILLISCYELGHQPIRLCASVSGSRSRSANSIPVVTSAFMACMRR